MAARRHLPWHDRAAGRRRTRRFVAVFQLLLALSAAAASPASLVPIDRPQLNASALSAPLVRQAQGKGWKGTGCMERFMNNNTDFRPCIEKTCFLFLQEAPYIVLDPGMTSVEEQFLFPCNKIPKRLRLLRGTSFLIMARTDAANALCAWAGRECGFNPLVDFVSYHAEAKEPYRFAITGLLLEFEGRLSEYVAPSVSLMQEQLSIIGPRKTSSDPFPYRRLTRPFQTGAWALFIALMVTYAGAAVGMAIVFGPRPVTTRGIFYFFMGDYTEADVARTTAAPPVPLPPTPPNTALNSADKSNTVVTLTKAISRMVTYRKRELTPLGPDSLDHVTEETAEKLHQDYVSRVISRLANYRVAKRLIQVALSATAVVFLLFYEIAVVNFLFIEQSRPRIQSVEQLSRRDLGRYSVQRDAATEVIWRRTVDPHGRFNESDFPWRRCRTELECFEWILDDANPVTLFVGFRTIGSYQVISRGACEEMAIYDTDKQLYTFGAGWLYGAAVPERDRRAIDVQVLELQVSDRLRKIVEDDIGSLDTRHCAPVIEDIDAGIIGASILVFVAPSLVLFTLIVLYYCVRKSRQARRAPRAGDTPRRASRRTPDARMSHAEITKFCELMLGRDARRRSRPASSSVQAADVHQVGEG